MISSRTPEGFPTRCPVCGANTNIEFSPEAGDALCPNCGTLLWQSAVVLDRLFELFGEQLGVSRENFTADTRLDVANGPHDSLDTVELVMQLEELYDLSITDDEAEKIQTVGDLIRFIQKRQRENGHLGEESE
jgi:acyl carrier protein